MLHPGENSSNPHSEYFKAEKSIDRVREDISTFIFGDPGKDSNMQPIPYEGIALPIELQGHFES